MEKYKIVVSEPWDFECGDGQNVIYGTIVREVTETALVFKLNKELQFGDDKGLYLLLHSRYRVPGETLLDTGDISGIANGDLILDSDFNAPLEDLLANSKFVIIGHLEKM